jgi:hypothetical protein
MATGDPREVLDLGGFNSQTGDTFETFTSLSDGITTLTVTDETQGTSESVKLVGDFTESDWNVTEDGSGGADVSDPPSSSSVAKVTAVDGSTFEFSLGSDQTNLAPGQIVTDSYKTTTGTVSVSIGGAGDDTFVFKPGVGADTIVNFNPQHDTIELDHFANIQNMQELAAAITPDAHGNAVIELGHGDSIAIPGVSTSFLQQHLQSMVHLH